MTKFWIALALLASPVGAWAGKPRPTLMIVGLPHLANPRLDISNTKVEDIMSASRQIEIEAVVDRLAMFRPNRIAVEWDAKDQAGLDRRYAAYRAGRRPLGKDETDQIGLRLAARLNLPRVHAADWNEDPPGADRDYDFATWLRTNGREHEWSSLQSRMRRQSDEMERFQRCSRIADWVRAYNDEASARRIEEPYYAIAAFGDAQVNPGAAWVGAWYARNLRIYANLLRLGGSPGDRTIAIFGAGHGPALRSFAKLSGRFALQDVVQYLPSPHRSTC